MNHAATGCFIAAVWTSVLPAAGGVDSSDAGAKVFILTFTGENKQRAPLLLPI